MVTIVKYDVRSVNAYEFNTINVAVLLSPNSIEVCDFTLTLSVPSDKYTSILFLNVKFHVPDVKYIVKGLILA